MVFGTMTQRNDRLKDTQVDQFNLKMKAAKKTKDQIKIHLKTTE